MWWGVLVINHSTGKVEIGRSLDRDLESQVRSAEVTAMGT